MKFRRPFFLIRLMVGGIFLSEGIQKFIFPAELGVGRFEKIGIPAAQFFGPFVGATEVICGIFLLLGLSTRVVTIPLIVDITVAIFTTKVPMSIHKGLWVVAHEGRVDYCMPLGLIFLFMNS